MIPAPIAPDEQERLAVLRQYQVLDTSPEACFDSLVQLAAHILAVPSALVVLTDADRQWCKARHGFAIEQVPRAESFCGHVVAQAASMIVGDARLDERFHDIPLVTGEAQIRFYAGVPLRNPKGFILGALCCIDTVPRQVTDRQLAMLQLLAGQVIELLELRRERLHAVAAAQTLAQSEATHRALLKARLDALINSAPDDISERKTMRARSEFIAMVSHELRAPLHATVGLAESLLDEPAEALSPRQRERIAMIVDSGHHLRDLVSDILDLSRIELGMLRLDCALTTVRAICDRSLAMVCDAAEQKQITLGRQYGSELPVLLADRKRLTQILVNLLDNAVKFTAPGGQVELAVRCSGANVEFLISDNGIGIADVDRERLFLPFNQVDSSANRKYQGTGLGLYLARRLALLHGGDISLLSTPGQGSTFTLTLPVQPPKGPPSS